MPKQPAVKPKVNRKQLESWTNLVTITPKRIDEWQKTMPDRSEWPAGTAGKVDAKAFELTEDGYALDAATAIAFAHVKALGTVSDTAGGTLGEEEKPGEEKAGMDVHSVHFAKENYPTEAEAKAACEKMGYKSDKPMHSDTHWGYEQFPKEELVGDEPKKAEIGEGVHAIVGTRNMDAAYEDNGEHKEDILDPLDEDLDPDDSELEEPEELPGKASDRFCETATDLIAEVQDLFDSAEATQDHPGILEAAPQWMEGLEAIVSELEGIQASNGTTKKKKEGEETKDDEDDENDVETDEEKKKRMPFRFVWGAGKALHPVLVEAKKTLAKLKSVYESDRTPRDEKLDARGRYRELKSFLKSLGAPGLTVTPAAANGIDNDAVLAAIKDQGKKLDTRLDRITGGLPTV